MARSQPPPFLTKTFQLVDGSEYDDVISWNEDGSAFVVWDTAQFSSLVLPKHFKHNNFSSFVRQLNTYGFSKVAAERWEFAHNFFKKGGKERLGEIRRKIGGSNMLVAAKLFPPTSAPTSAEFFLRKVSPSVSGEDQVISADSLTSGGEIGGSGSDLIGENEWLRKENLRLHKELSQMKSLCKNIYVLMSCYGSEEANSVESAMKALDLLPVSRHGAAMEVDDEEKGIGESSSIKSAAAEIREAMFGMPVAAKRMRTCEMDLQLQQPADEKSDKGQGSSSLA